MWIRAGEQKGGGSTQHTRVISRIKVIRMCEDIRANEGTAGERETLA